MPVYDVRIIITESHRIFFEADDIDALYDYLYSEGELSLQTTALMHGGHPTLVTVDHDVIREVGATPDVRINS